MALLTDLSFEQPNPDVYFQEQPASEVAEIVTLYTFRKFREKQDLDDDDTVILCKKKMRNNFSSIFRLRWLSICIISIAN